MRYKTKTCNIEGNVLYDGRQKIKKMYCDVFSMAIIFKIMIIQINLINLSFFWVVVVLA